MFTWTQTEPTLDINYEAKINRSSPNKFCWVMIYITDEVGNVIKKYKRFFRQVRNEIIIIKKTEFLFLHAEQSSGGTEC